uniref:Uncharacterized protein n=1 Tax=Panagrolaimus davidi TaxID=227884 RepID=A0A914PP74_9BILA
MGGGNDDNNGGNGGGSGKQGFASMPKEQVSEIGKMGAEARKEKYGLQDHTDQHPREWLRERTQLKDIVQAARERKWNYLRKLMLLPDDRWNRKLTEWTPNTRRPVGRPPTRWMDDFTKYTNKKFDELLSLCLTNFWCCNVSPFVLRDR